MNFFLMRIRTILALFLIHTISFAQTDFEILDSLFEQYSDERDLAKSDSIWKIQKEQFFGINADHDCKILINESEVNLQSSKPQQAQLTALKAIELKDRVLAKLYIVKAYFKLGTAHEQSAAFDKARAAYAKGIKIAKENNIREEAARGYNYISFMLSTTGNHDSAVFYNDLAIKTLPENSEMLVDLMIEKGQML
ncbi:MAG: hypothetical protein MRY83_05795, partial [Flavobacteriales bacterium]|nr:hypothetical protein [Flavobacteriales bacterium]